MKSSATTVDEYLARLPEDRRRSAQAVREVILEDLPEGFVEGIEYGMLSYVVPLERYPRTYNGQPLMYAGLASQKSYLSLYLMNVYGEREAAFRAEYASTGKRLNMGRSCVRFRKADDLALDIIGRQIRADTLESFVEYYEASRRR